MSDRKCQSRKLKALSGRPVRQTKSSIKCPKCETALQKFKSPKGFNYVWCYQCNFTKVIKEKS
jgi:protein-arginine kinase activator protein McsA